MSQEAQKSASDPQASAFVSAHAGTGKTKLLIDRLLRLMLAGADPARILCLTYTKAAAAEMAIRLQRRLGIWVALPDSALDAQLADLDMPATAATRAAARALFASVLDLPGGMRIGTIHAFCQSLLKRFPLEAAISPHFQLLEAAEARASLDQAREHTLPAARAEDLAALAGLVGADEFANLSGVLEKNRHRLATTLALPAHALLAALRRAGGVRHADADAVMRAAIAWPDEAPLRSALQRAAQHGSPAVAKKAGAMLLWLGLDPDDRREHWQKWVEEFFRAGGEPRSPGVFAAPKLADLHPDIVPACLAEQARIGTVLDQLRALRMAEATAALLRLAAPILRHHAEAKDRRALVDYDDLIGRTRTLLENQGAAWVLFKLDGGLDHLLLDEVQDTAPAQWAIADRLTADFFAGDAAHAESPLARTMFAVGDRKQSIYAFQGADPAEFDHWRHIYGQRVTGAGLAWRPTVLALSFRSTAPVLALVDAIASGLGPDGGVAAPGETIAHVPQRAGQAGRVELWPATPRPEAAGHTPWTIPEHNQTRVSAVQTLVNRLSGWIAEEVRAGAINPGEILILVRRRGDFDRALVRALKSAGVKVAGLDRMVLTDQPAVQDLLALCRALLLPQDDLSLAEMLTSPLGDLGDDSLMRLATGRSGNLWETLRARAHEQPDWAAAERFFTTLLGRVDYAQPHALLCEALGPLGGRARLFARLGPEAAEPVDEFLSTALLHATRHPPSLQGFLHWLTLSAAEVVRQPDAAGDAVRIMTVHGSKGLEAGLVILPDTTSLPPEERGFCWVRDDATGADLPLWSPHPDLSCQTIKDARDAGQAARLREYNRLLYVALTRARDRLLICGWETHRAQPGNWHELAKSALLALGATATPHAAWPGDALTLQTPQTAPADAASRPPRSIPAAPPEWAGNAPHWRPHPLPPEPPLPSPLSPSRPDGIEYGPVPPARSPLATVQGCRDSGGAPGRFNRGLVIHTLLQHLPDLPPAERAAAALAYAARPAHHLADPAEAASEALAVLENPGLAPLFGPSSRAEQRLSGLVAGRLVSGQVDRLAILDHAILIADYKTRRSPPDTPDGVPVLYLRQMAAYRAVLSGLYPTRPITCLLIWTDGPSILELPAALLDAHAPPALAA